MAGGKGTRMNLDGEKLLLKYKKPVVFHVIESLSESNYFSKIIAVTSPNAPKTRRLLKEKNIEIFDSSGHGYVVDLNLILQTINDLVLVMPGDLPLLDKNIIKEIVCQHDVSNVWTSIIVTNKFLNSIGLKSDYLVTVKNQECVYSGISMINSTKIKSLENQTEDYIIIDDKRIAFNLNTSDDYNLLGTT